MTEPIEGHRLDVGQELGQTLDNLVKQGALLVTLPAFDHQRGLADPPCLGGTEAPLVDGLDLVGEKEGRFADGPLVALAPESSFQHPPVPVAADARHEGGEGRWPVAGGEGRHRRPDHPLHEVQARRAIEGAAGRGLQQGEGMYCRRLVEGELQADLATGGMPNIVDGLKAKMPEERRAVARVIPEGQMIWGPGCTIAGPADLNHTEVVQLVARPERRKPVTEHASVDEQDGFAASALDVLKRGIIYR